MSSENDNVGALYWLCPNYNYDLTEEIGRIVLENDHYIVFNHTRGGTTDNGECEKKIIPKSLVMYYFKAVMEKDEVKADAEVVSIVREKSSV